MSAIPLMSRLELAAYICSELEKCGIDLVLSGGSCVSIYSSEQYVSMDLDFVQKSVFSRFRQIQIAMKSLGFTEKNRYFIHPGTAYFVEFPPGPPSLGNEPLSEIHNISTAYGILKILSPTDCVKDRLTWYFHNQDRQCLEQAILVALCHDLNFDEIKRWSIQENKKEEYLKILPLFLKQA